MTKKVLKLCCYPWVNASRDKRELSVCQELGMAVEVLAKGEGEECGKFSKVDGFDVYKVTTRPFPNFPISVNRFISIFLFAHQARKMTPDIISGHDLLGLFVGWMSNILRMHKAILIYDSHEFEYARNENRSKVQLFVIKYLERFLMKRCVFSMMVNDSIADEVVKLHNLKEKPIVVRNIPYYWNIDEKVIKEKKDIFRKDNNIPSHAKLILYQGGLLKNRGIENAIKAISKLDNAYLLILGNGSDDYVGSLQHLVFDLGVNNRVIFHPAAAYNELWKYTGIADIGLCILENVCKNHYYALPNKFSEYIQALVPVVTNDFPELRRIVDKYEIGRYCNADDFEELAKVLGELISSSGALVKYRTNLKVAKEELCWENEKQILINAYKELV